ncbi:MAG: MCP four helix bundle domain-containing protein, partial [Curvibacter sp.]
MRIKDVKIGTKLLGGFVIVLALVTLQSLYTMIQAARINSQSSTIADHWLPAATIMAGASDHVSRMRSTQFQHLLNRNPADKTTLASEMDKLVAQVSGQIAEYSRLPLSDTERQLLAALETDWRTYQSQQKELVKLSSNLQEDAANQLVTGPALKTYESVVAQLAKIADTALKGGRDASEHGDALYLEMRVLLVAVLLLVIGIGLLVGWTLSRTIGQGVARAAAVADLVAQGRLDQAIQANSRDELGQLLQALARMQDGLIQVVSRVRQGSETVSTASAEIAQGNQDLSARTESQASSLEETAASMEQLGSTVKQNADNARTA